MTTVCVFAPSVLVTVTVEDHPRGEQLHFHAGGQGTWVARMTTRLGADAVLCTPLGGEAGAVARALIDREGVDVRAVLHDVDTAAYVHDRRSGERSPLVEVPAPALGRHTLDELYGMTLGEALVSDVTVLTGAPSDDVLPADTYTRLAHDLRAIQAPVVADLHGAQLEAALEGGLDLLKISDDELRQDGLLAEGADEAAVVAAAQLLHQRGARAVVVSRAAAGAIALFGDAVYSAVTPHLASVDTRGAGDSMTAALTVGLAERLDPEALLRFATAAGCLNVTRHGLATGYRPTIERLSERIRVTRWAGSGRVPLMLDSTA